MIQVIENKRRRAALIANFYGFLGLACAAALVLAAGLTASPQSSAPKAAKSGTPASKSSNLDVAPDLAQRVAKFKRVQM
ncbi:MAG: hypothetical protein WBP79_15385, partial [Candidatus Acidiferrales bacterium]